MRRRNRAQARARSAGVRHDGAAGVDGSGVESWWSCRRPPSDAEVATRRAEDEQGDEQAHDGQQKGDGRAVAVVAELERGAVHVQRQRRGRVARAAAGEGEDRVEDLDRAVDAEDDRGEQDRQRHRQDDVAEEA